MTCFIISYDLRNARDYDKLHDAIRAYGTWAHILESCWGIVTEDTAKDVRNNLTKHIDDDDGLFVVKSGNIAAWRNVLCKNDWLNKNL
jgi:hypothetical protein